MKARLIITLSIIILAFIFVPYFVIVASRPTMPKELSKLFPANARLGFVVDLVELLPSLPKEISEKISPRLNAFATSSKVHVATSEDMKEFYIILLGSPDLETVASMIGGKFSKTSIGGMDTALIEGGCFVQVNEKDIFAVFGEKPLDLATDRIMNFGKAPHMEKTLAKRYVDLKPGLAFKAFGFPEEETPILLPGDHFYDLQMETKFFTLMVERQGTSVYCKLIIFFYDRAARDLEILQTPTVLQNYANMFPAAIPFISKITYKSTTNNSIQYEMTLSQDDFDEFTDAPVASPPPAKTPIIPDLPELPF